MSTIVPNMSTAVYLTKQFQPILFTRHLTDIPDRLSGYLSGLPLNKQALTTPEVTTEATPEAG